jgi:catechol 2,3-dioxygenase-like lactoylglutathione lyase family enzyme
VFLELLHDSGIDTGHLLVPGSVVDLDAGECKVTHPGDEPSTLRPFTDKRAYLDDYRRAWQPWLADERASWSHGRRDLVAELATWFEPLLRSAPITSAGVAGNVVIDIGEPGSDVCIDFVESQVRAWKGEAEEPYVYKADVDRRLVEALLERHTEDWVNALFLSCRFVGHRPDPANFNEFVMTFFKALSPGRIAYVERCYRERRAQTDEFFERDGWRIERFCPHRQADLTRFGEIDGGVLTCSLHHWQFDLATGRCLTSDDRRLRCERVEDSESVSAFNHVGQCVTDLERSKRFYCELFGFTLEREINPPDESSAKLLSLSPPLDMTAAYLVRDGLVLELLHFGADGQTQPFRERRMNEPGLTHISLSVDDVDDVCARVPEFGGDVIGSSNIGNAVFVRDPDGQLVELLPMTYRRHLDAQGFH